MNHFIFPILALLLAVSARAQKKVPATIKQLQQQEESMRQFADAIVNATETADRSVADSIFTRALVQALKTPYSFSYPFDSLTTISKLYAPDSTFRIITWQVMKDFTYYRQKGAIQFRTADGSLKLTPLYDASPFTDNPFDSARSNMQWIGAVYYNIIQKTYNNKNYYTLLGYDENDERSTRKWMEVLTFDDNNRPVFGGRYFNFPSDGIKPPQPAYRFCLEFKKEANAKLNYDPALDIITFAKLESETGVPTEHYTLVPTGGYEGFKWTNGKWVFMPVVREVDPRGTVNPPQPGAPRRGDKPLPIGGN